jgi:hypothetical protein
MKRRRIIILSIIALVLVAVFGWKGYGWWLKHKLERYRAELVAKGEKLTIDELLKDRPSLKHNGADLFYEAQAHLLYGPVMTTNQPPTMQLILPGKALVSWRRPVLVNSSWNNATNTWEELAEELAGSQKGIQALHGLIERPDMDFGVNYAQGFTAPLPSLGKLKFAAQVLSAAAMVDLHQGATASAATNIASALALSEGMSHERVIICQLVRIAITHIAITAVWEATQAPGISEAELRLLQGRLMKLEFFVPMRRSLEMERAMGAINIQHYRANGGIYTMFGGGAAPAPVSTTEKVITGAKRLVSPKEIRKSSNELLWQTALSYEDELKAVQGLQVLISASRQIEQGESCFMVISNATRELADLGLIVDKDDDHGSSPWGEDPSLEVLRELFSGSAPAVLKSIKKAEQMEAVRSIAVTAIALKRYQLGRGNLPPTLAALVPDYLPVVPLDPVDGQPLRYRLNPDGTFGLYSIGEDGVDDGGDAARPGSNSSRRPNFVFARDWVWPQPATAKEIKAWVAEGGGRSSK